MITPWEIPISNTSSLSDAVDIWYVSVPDFLSKIDLLKIFLSSDEFTRAQQYYFESDRKKFIIARAGLRVILSRYLELSPRAIQFDYDQGKPFLPAYPDCQFNISHSEEVVLYVVTKKFPVGIDVEYMAKNHNVIDIAKRFFSDIEAEQLEKIKETDRETYFYYLWTQKEAFIKAIGQGLLYSLSRFIVPMDPFALHQSPIIHDDPTLAAGWQLRTFQPVEGYMAAVAMSSTQNTLHFYQLI